MNPVIATMLGLAGMFSVFWGLALLWAAWRARDRAAIMISISMFLIGCITYSYAYPNWQITAWGDGEWREKQQSKD